MQRPTTNRAVRTLTQRSSNCWDAREGIVNGAAKGSRNPAGGPIMRGRDCFAAGPVRPRRVASLWARACTSGRGAMLAAIAAALVTLAGAGPAFAQSITVTGGHSQSTTVNNAFTSNLQVTVLDASNNPVSGVPVTFTAPASGASATFSGSNVTTVTTSASGVASVTATANAIAGNYSVSATAAGVGQA